MVTFRRIDAEERVRHQTIKDHAFDSDPGPPSYDGPDDVPDRLAQRWGLFDGTELVSVCLLFDLRARLAGDWHPIGGIGALVTPPERRSRGHAVTLQREALATFRERGYPYAVLWPMSIPYYRESGWGLVATETEYECPPAALPSAPADGRFERVGAAEYDRLESVYADWASRYDLALDRSADWWRKRVLDDAWVYAWTPADEGAPAGYVVYRLEGNASVGGDAATLIVEELAARTATARRHLLAFLRRHESQADVIRWSCPAERRLLYEAADPDAVEATTSPGPMGRVVDVPAAIEALPADAVPPAGITLAVTDPLSVVDGRYRIGPGPSGPTCEPTDTDPDTTVSVGLLSQLVVGTLAPSTAAERGDLSAPDEVVDALGSVFHERAVYLTDFF